MHCKTSNQIGKVSKSSIYQRAAFPVQCPVQITLALMLSVCRLVNNVVSAWWGLEIFVKLSVKFLFEINFHYDRYVASNIHKVLSWEQKTPETSVKSNILYLFIFCPLSDRVIKHFYCPGPGPGFDQSIGVQNLTVWEGRPAGAAVQEGEFGNLLWNWQYRIFSSFLRKKPLCIQTDLVSKSQFLFRTFVFMALLELDRNHT